MATNTGAHQNGGSSTQQGYRSPHVSPWYKVLGAVAITLGVMVLLAKLLHFCLRSLKDNDDDDDQEAAADRRGRRAPPPSDAADRRRRVPRVVLLVDAGSGGSRDRDRAAVAVVPSPQPPAAAAAVAVELEMVRAMGPLVCTYLRADGWPAEAACAVCLAELADGDALRVLPACMHYFHAACVGEWLRAHGTCPLCRAPLAPSPAAADDAAAA